MNDNRRIVITVLILLGICCICFCVIAVGAWAVQVLIPQFSSQSPSLSSTPAANPPQNPRPTAIPRSGTDDSSSSEIPPYVVAQMDIIQEEVVELRGLSPSQSVERALLSPEQLKQHVLEDFLAEYSPEEAQQDAIVLAAFGLLEPGFDLLTFYEELFSEQIAGFYDDETKDMYVVQEQSFEGIQRMTYAHEYTHVLQDQVYDFKDGLGYDDDACEADSERCAAIQALIEGDATLAELNWFQNYSTDEDKQQVMDFYNTYESPVYDSSPAFLKQDFLFPYNNGLTFVQALYDEGGWEAVDDAYANVPVSTEQILHPEKYPSELPIAVELPDFRATLGEGWEEFDRGVMGEWYTYLILGHGNNPAGRIEDATALAAAAGWGGDGYAVYHNEQDNQTVMVLHFVWDTPEDAAEFIAAFQLYATGCYGDPTASQADRMTWQGANGVHDLRIQDKEVSWIFAPQADAAQAIWEVLQP